MSNIIAGMTRRRRVGSPVVKSVLMFMADCASDDGDGIWTSKANMAADLELSKRSVQNAILELISTGLISEVGSRKCDRGYTVEYRINLEAVQALPVTREKFKPRGESPAPVHDVHPKGCMTFTSTGESPAPKPSLEPSLEPSLDHRPRDDLFSALGSAPRGLATGSLDEAFARFWKVYPRKEAKPAAFKNFAKAVKDGADPEAIIAGAAVYAKTDAVARGYAKMPQGWLTDRRWEDEDLKPQEDPAIANLRRIREEAERAARGRMQ